MIFTKTCKVLPNQEKVHESGRGEVTLAKVELTPLSINFIPTSDFLRNT